MNGIFISPKTALLCGLSINDIDSRDNRMVAVRLRELLAEEDETESNDETENEEEREDSVPSTDEDSRENRSDPEVLQPIEGTQPFVRDQDRQCYVPTSDLPGEMGDTASTPTPPTEDTVAEPPTEEAEMNLQGGIDDHGEFLGLFVQRGDVVRTNDGEEEYVYDPAAYPEDSD